MTESSSAPLLREALLQILRSRAYTRSEEPFVLSSGALSHDYVDIRRGLARGEDLNAAAEAVIATLDDAGYQFDAIGGMTMGADPVAHAVALITGKEWYSVRKAEKTHGSKQRIEGAKVGPGRSVLLFEDTVSTGGSILDALDVVEASGATVVAACTLLDRGDRAIEQFAMRSVPYISLLTYRDLNIDPIGQKAP